MTNWIPLSERLPTIPEEVMVTDGFIVLESFIWDPPRDGVYFEVPNDFTPIWWRPFKDSAIAQDFERNTRKPINHQELINDLD